MDTVLQGLVETTQPSVSVRRIIRKKKIADVSEEQIAEIEVILITKSLAHQKGHDSQGFASFSLSETGRDFLKQFGTYDKYLKGLKQEKRKAERAKAKKPYRANTFNKGEAPAPYSPPEKSFLQKNVVGVIILALFLILFFMIANI
jgi:hypothetical protein